MRQLHTDRPWDNFHPVRIADHWGVIGYSHHEWFLLADGLTHDTAILIVNGLLERYAPDKIAGAA